MNKRVWTFQYKKDVEQKGPKASWYVGWYDLDAKRHAESCGPGTRGENEANKRKRRIEAELLTGTHEPSGKTAWARFRERYDREELDNLKPSSVKEAKIGLRHFERIVKPCRMDRIRSETIGDFIAKRKLEPGLNPESTVSPATVNKDLRHIKAALRTAYDWGYMPKVPTIKMLREPEKLSRYVAAEHFTLLYDEACTIARLPRNPDQHYKPMDWWRGLLTMAYMTGWRIGELLALRREDLDLEAGTAITRAVDNKGGRDELVPLHPIVVEHLRVLLTPPPLSAGERRTVAPYHLVFRWAHDCNRLWKEFRRIQEAVGIHLPCPERHEHTPACHVYGFHDFRRAFATVNHDTLTGDTLQRMMRHKSYQTTQRYINMAGKLTGAVGKLVVPDVLQPRASQPVA